MTLRRFMPFTADQMFSLVSDIEHYPEFLPMCLKVSILDHSVTDAGVIQLIAKMQVGYGLIRDAFTSTVTLNKAHYTIRALGIEGPLACLENQWRFLPGAENLPQCHIDFYLAYAFKSVLWEKAFAPFAATAGHKYVSAFQKRAAALYGDPPSLIV